MVSANRLKELERLEANVEDIIHMAVLERITQERACKRKCKRKQKQR